MEQVTFCEYCQKEIKGRPFIPVHSALTFHWKCFINKIKEERTPSENIEEREEPRTVEEES
ncbi:MAG: hypothetical protein JSW07_05305 [bacterium]|nr:MAG: hypothetical protein JSW07_05305 [bacterium]